MSTRSMRIDDAVFMATGKIVPIQTNDEVETVTVSQPAFMFTDGKPRKRNLDVGPQGKRHLDRLIADMRKAGAPLFDFLTENNPEETATEESEEETSKDSKKDTPKIEVIEESTPKIEVMEDSDS